jgi:type II secretory pathway pseudopilin PulG
MKKTVAAMITNLNSGQTMVEALVALAAAVIIISSITVAVITSSSNTSYSTKQNKATQLAREGLDVMRKYRDQNAVEFAETSGMYCFGDELVLNQSVDKPSDCAPNTMVDEIYIRTIHFIPIGEENNTCGEAIQINAMVSWADSKCSVNDQYCKNVKLVTCMSSSSIMQSESGSSGGNL